ncbi:hypothetical protein HJC23_003393 [Cyclotella cryptica]|uniref:DnaJ-like protein C11 C-terminal domain-containing protein n=1 Tax=Cyclotella cryptica TaxID=29204 RepID=A0ABD3NSP0_9STRA|eukprot:CCRYP_019854-RA/>CCRYP_019854-RA protein AED:0.07 eAED:0.07 QI:0/-1/0/1/-1/1/1/0/770
MESDPFEHIGDIHSSYNKHHDVQPLGDRKESNDDFVMFRKHPPDQVGALSHRPPSPEVYSVDTSPQQDGNDDCIRKLLDPTIGYVRRASIVIPVEMMLNGVANEQVDHGTIVTSRDKPSDNSRHVFTSAEAGPTYSIKRSRLALYAAFSPPPVFLTRNDDRRFDDKSLYRFTAQEWISAKQRLERHSGFHGAVGFTSATSHEHGYADTILSLNYRLPKLLSLPFARHQFNTIGNLHYNLHLGAHTKQSLGATAYSLDGKSSVCLDVGNPFLRNPSSLVSNTGILRPRLDQRNYTISASRDIYLGSNSFRIQSMMMLSPIPRHNVITSKPPALTQSLLHSSGVHNFAVVVTNLDSPNSNQSKQPKLSISLDYGRDSSSWYHFPQSGVYLPEIDITREENKKSSSFPVAYSASVKVDVKQQLSASQTCHVFVKYRRLGQNLSLGTMVTRTFSFSRLSRLGVGVRLVFEDIWDRKLWKQAKTFSLLQLERGDSSVSIPIAIHPLALTTWDSCIRMFYASVVSITVDTIVAELLCNATSILRLKFLQLLLGTGYKDEKYLHYSRQGIKTDQQQDEELLREQHVAKACQDAFKQRNSMEKQARHIAEKEGEHHGLVITKAIYGVMDTESHQWILPRTKGNESFCSCALDATIPLQFWVSNGTLRMPAVSKKHMLGFYNVLDCVSNEDWISDRAPLPSNANLNTGASSNVIQKMYQWCRNQLNGTPKNSETWKDLVAVLSIRYKWEDKLFDAMFYDHEAVELPSSRAKEVILGSTS